MGAPSNSSVPTSVLATVPELTSVPAKVVLPDWLTVSVVPPAILTLAEPLPANVPERLLTVWLAPRFNVEVIVSAALTTSGPEPMLPVAVVVSVPPKTVVPPE